ncbi:VOC family protein [Streptomyces maremycinicus]|uniref:VOC family protein n=1 Tax=Streptomyces maremycinicus TaxID=1679753 RepID=UPI000788A873|nr:hypothetical protein [Streptomyces sp. NBRC 110468]
MLGDTSGFGSCSVDDIERAKEFCGRTLGLNIDMDDTKGIARDAAPGTSIAWFKDPAGNILSVIHNRKA